MSFDAKKFPMIDMANPPTCKECGGLLQPVISNQNAGMWYCPDDDCDADPETAAELDNRLQSLAEAAFERQQERGTGEGFLSPDAMQRSLKR